MAVLQKIREFFTTQEEEEKFLPVTPAPPTEYEIHPLTSKRIEEVMLLNRRCFRRGEHYGKHILSYLLSEPTTLSYCATTPTDEIVAFAFITIDQDGTGHITTVGVAPEHRRRRLAEKLLIHAENALRRRDVRIVRLEVRVSNTGAQSLYRQLDYSTVQRLNRYYTNGEDGFLMVKSLY